MKPVLAIAATMLLLWGCDTIDKKQVQRTNDKSPFSNTYKTQTEKLIHLEETMPDGASLSNIILLTEGFEHELSDTINGVDPISNVLMADLDKNGFDEIYIITVSSGSGGYGDIIGFASNNDKSMSLIYLPKIEDLGHASKMLFKGYRGHDRFYIDEDKLVREFPTYQDSDTNAKPSGGVQNIVYHLLAGEAGWILKID